MKYMKIELYRVVIGAELTSHDQIHHYDPITDWKRRQEEGFN